MIELAPNHKVGFAIRNPVMTAAGCYGWGREYHGTLDTESLGAIVVGPVTARPRAGAPPPRLIAFPGGLLLATGSANAGVSRVVRDNWRSWSQSPAPVIVHVSATSVDDVASCCSRLSLMEEVAAVELGVPDHWSRDETIELVAAARDTVAQPLLVQVPLAGAEATALLAEESGADAVTLGSAPRGTLYHREARRFVSGRLLGPFVLALVLAALGRVQTEVSLPVIGSGGVWTVGDARSLLQAGCAAVQVGGMLWRDPSSVASMAAALS